MSNAAIIIPHYCDHARLGRCLEALAPQLIEGVEVVVVDNASPETPVCDHPNIRVVVETEKGAANTRNRGVSETTAERIFFLDCDCVPTPDWVETALAVADRADLVGGTVTVFDETTPPRSGAEAFETVFAFDNRGYIERKGFSVTANLLTHRRVFEVIGGFRHGMSEDLDWCRRATAAGFAVVHDDTLRVAHPTRQDWPELMRKWRRLTDEAWGLEGRSRIARAKWVLRALAMPASAIAHLPKVLGHPDLSASEKRAAALTLLRLRLTRMRWMLSQALK